MAATVFSSMALASGAVPCANAVVENKAAMGPRAPITSLRNMDIPPCSSSNLQLSCTVRGLAGHHIQTFPPIAQPTGARQRADKKRWGGHFRIWHQAAVRQAAGLGPARVKTTQTPPARNI